MAAEHIVWVGFSGSIFLLSPRREDAKNTKGIGKMTEDGFGRQIVDIAVQIHRAVGPGLLRLPERSR